MDWLWAFSKNTRLDNKIFSRDKHSSLYRYIETDGENCFMTFNGGREKNIPSVEIARRFWFCILMHCTPFPRMESRCQKILTHLFGFINHKTVTVKASSQKYRNLVTFRKENIFYSLLKHPSLHRIIEFFKVQL